MSKNKLAKFAEMEHYPHVVQAGSIATATVMARNTSLRVFFKATLLKIMNSEL